MTVLVTGVSGFVGLHVAEALLARGDSVLGTAEAEPGADPALDKARLERLAGHDRFHLAAGAPGERGSMAELARLAGEEIDAVVHVVPTGASALAGRSTADALARHLALLELCREHLRDVRHLVHVRSSRRTSGAIRDDAEEVVSRAWARAHGLPVTGVRLSDVYGSWGDPGMPIWVALDAVLAGRPVPIEGMTAQRLLDVGDAAGGVLAALDRPPERQLMGIPHQTFDLAGPEEVSPDRVVEWLRSALVDPSAGGAPDERSALDGERGVDHGGATGLDWRPGTTAYHGVRRFTGWHREWHRTV